MKLVKHWLVFFFLNCVVSQTHFAQRGYRVSVLVDTQNQASCSKLAYLRRGIGLDDLPINSVPVLGFTIFRSILQLIVQCILFFHVTYYSYVLICFSWSHVCLAPGLTLICELYLTVRFLVPSLWPISWHPMPALLYVPPSASTFTGVCYYMRPALLYNTSLP